MYLHHHKPLSGQRRTCFDGLCGKTSGSAIRFSHQGSDEKRFRDDVAELRKRFFLFLFSCFKRFFFFLGFLFLSLYSNGGSYYIVYLIEGISLDEMRVNKCK